MRPAREGDDPAAPSEIDGIPVPRCCAAAASAGADLVALADGRYAVTGAGVIAIGGRRALAGWCERRAERAGRRPGGARLVAGGDRSADRPRP